MLKRTLALLLVFLLLPAAALAEAFRLDVTVDLEPEAAASVIRQTGLFEGADDEAALAAAFVDFMDGLTLHMTTQEDASRLEIVFDETPLLDLTLLMGGEDIILTSDMLEGTGFSIPLELLSQENSSLLHILQDTDWADLASRMFTAAMEVLDGAEVTHARGSFNGDAYTGGVYCDTIILDDKIIAEALDAAMIRSARNAVTYICYCLGVDGDTLLQQLSATHAAAAEANEHRYIIRIVSDANEAVIGASLTVMRGEKQLATLSIGLKDNGLRIVVGLPMDTVNYWHDHEITLACETGDDGVTMYSLTGALTEFTAAKDEDFASASAHISDTRLRVQWSATVGTQGGGLSWSTVVSTRAGDSLIMDKTENQGLYIPGVRFVNNATYTRNGKVWMTEKTMWAPCDPIDASGEGLVLCDLLNPDEALMNEMALTMGGELAMRLLQVIPAQLLLFFQ